MALTHQKVTYLAWHTDSVSEKTNIKTVDSPSRGVAITMIWTGILGWVAAFSLVLERIHVASNPDATLSCDINPFISCKSVMLTAQAQLFGFPNPIIGLAAFFAPVVLGFAILAGARFALWFWRAFLVGIALGFAFVLWLFVQSTFVIHVLCPYCMVAWVAMVPLFWRLFLWAAAEGIIDVPVRTVGFFVRWADSAWVFTLVTELLAVITIVFSFWSLWPILFK
jgi:uncharacterized membrane protein